MPMSGARPFASHEWLIAWRYMRARRREGGISVIVWYSLIGIALAVATLIVVMAVMYGFRQEFTSRILGAEGHLKVYPHIRFVDGRQVRTIDEYDPVAGRIAAAPGVTRAAPIIEGQALASYRDRNVGVIARGLRPADLATLTWVATPEQSFGRLEDYPDGVAIGAGVARDLGVVVGDEITLTLPGGLITPFGPAPKIESFPIVYIFQIGRADVDGVRLYMPFQTAQSYFNRTDVADAIEVIVDAPHALGGRFAPSTQENAILSAAGQGYFIWTWKDANGAFLTALDIERNTMFLILAMIVLIAALNIISGLVMLVKNKGRDIGILRTMGVSQGGILRIFFICGAGVGVVGTVAGVIIGVAFTLNIDHVFVVVNLLAGGDMWNPEIRTLSTLPAELRLYDIARAVILSLGLSFGVTIFPARNAARLNPMEALRYE